MSPGKRGMVPGYPGTLGRSAWLHVGFREMTSVPVGGSEIEDPTLSQTAWGETMSGHSSLIPQKHGWAQ